MADVSRFNGAPAAGGFYGYQPKFVKVAATNKFTADTGGAGTAITEGGYSKAVKAAQVVGSIVILGARDSGSDYFSCVFDAATVNDGAGDTTAGAWGAFIDALAATVGGTAGDYAVTSGTEINGDGTITYA